MPGLCCDRFVADLWGRGGGGGGGDLVDGGNPVRYSSTGSTYILTVDTEVGWTRIAASTFCGELNWSWDVLQLHYVHCHLDTGRFY